jgi:hypothetical protein
MIPKPYIAKWQDHAPWSSFDQVEQDLVISRVLIALFSDEFLRENLAFRGGSRRISQGKFMGLMISIVFPDHYTFKLPILIRPENQSNYA